MLRNRTLQRGPLARLALLFVAAAGGAASPPSHERILPLMGDDGAARRAAARELVAADARGLVPGLVDAVFFTPKRFRGEIARTLAELTGHAAAGEDYYAWVEWLGSRDDFPPAPGYVEWKRRQFGRIDPAYLGLFHEGVPARIRIEEIVFGGARLDGIPALDDPPHVAADEASLAADELVFGVALGGETRAYPHRYLSWHEMANDVVGGEPLTLSYCTLCGSGVVYSARRDGGARERFGSSGLLYRSNKLMFDRSTHSLWHNLTGEAVVGERAAEGARLEPLPVTVTTWGAWRAAHPETTVVALPPDYGARWGFDYRPGAADRQRAGVRFPVWRQSARLPREEEILGLRIGGAAKAYPTAAAEAAGVINDRLAETPLVIVADPASGTLRAYRRGERTFRREATGALVDERGRAWEETETALVPPPGGGEAPLARLPSHLAFWFGWFGFFPETEVWAPPSG